MISKVARWYTHAHTPVQYYGDMIDLCALRTLRNRAYFFLYRVLSKFFCQWCFCRAYDGYFMFFNFFTFQLTEDVARKKTEYQKYLELYKLMRSRFEEHYVKCK